MKTPAERADLVWQQHMTDQGAAELRLKERVREQIEDALREERQALREWVGVRSHPEDYRGSKVVYADDLDTWLDIREQGNG